MISISLLVITFADLGEHFSEITSKSRESMLSQLRKDLPSSSIIIFLFCFVLIFSLLC